jgi:hypothetical protein
MPISARISDNSFIFPETISNEGPAWFFCVENGFLRVSADMQTYGSGLYPAPAGDLRSPSGKHIIILTELIT